MLDIVPVVADKVFCLFFVFTVSSIGFKSILGFAFWALRECKEQLSGVRESKRGQVDWGRSEFEAPPNPR